MTRLVHQTDLFHPHGDPDDHWDLASVYALAMRGAFDLRGVMLDYPPDHRAGDPATLAMAQLGFITLGIFAIDDLGAQGAVMQMVNHGLVVGALLFVIAVLTARAGGSPTLAQMGGIALRAPVLAALFLIVTLATLAMPGSPNFVGEILIVFGALEDKLVFGLIASVGIALAAVYAIRLFQKSMHNRVGPGVDGDPWAMTILSVRMMSGGIFSMSLGNLMILTGGALIHGNRSEEVVRAAIDINDPWKLIPRNPAIKKDTQYILASMGLLAGYDKEAAFRILNQTFGKDDDDGTC